MTEEQVQTFMEVMTSTREEAECYIRHFHGNLEAAMNEYMDNGRQPTPRNRGGTASGSSGANVWGGGASTRNVPAPGQSSSSGSSGRNRGLFGLGNIRVEGGNVVSTQGDRTEWVGSVDPSGRITFFDTPRPYPPETPEQAPVQAATTTSTSTSTSTSGMTTTYDAGTEAIIKKLRQGKEKKTNVSKKPVEEKQTIDYLCPSCQDVIDMAIVPVCEQSDKSKSGAYLPIFGGMSTRR